jgi:hypothetical protein
MSRTHDALLNAIASDIADGVDGGVLVTDFVVIANCVDGDGDRSVYSKTAHDQRCSDTLGLLAFVLAREQARAAGLLDDGEVD